MIYMDNAATSFPKPPEVHAALSEALERCGNPGRGSHELAVWSGEKIIEAREAFAELLHVEDPFRIAFTLNATHSLNLAVSLCYGEILTTAMDHNSVLRPCYKRGYCRIVPADPDGNIPPERILSSISDMTGAVIMTHASNVTGQIYNIEPVARECRRRGILFILDAAQSAGTAELDMSRIPVDVLCLTGHKGLFGLQGTGAIYVAPNVPTRPYMCGGTGSNTFDFRHPDQMPDCFEAGTVNTPGVCALCAGIRHVLSKGVKKIHYEESMLRKRLVDGLSKVKDVVIYGDGKYSSTGVVSINIKDVDPAVLGGYLAEHHVCVRSGFHCAPLAHRALGTESVGGTVRLSLNHFNTQAEIEHIIKLIGDFQKKL